MNDDNQLAPPTKPESTPQPNLPEPTDQPAPVSPTPQLVRFAPATQPVPAQPQQVTPPAQESAPAAPQPTTKPDTYGTPPANTYQSYSQMQPGTGGSKKILIVAVLLIALLTAGGAVAYKVVKGSSDSKKDSSSEKKSSFNADAANQKEADTSEATDASNETTDSTSQASSELSLRDAIAHDAQRRADLNSIYQKLEEYFNENNGYPSKTLSSDLLLGIDAESLKDTNGKAINQTDAVSDSTVPESPYTKGTSPTISEYTYAPYECSTQGGELLCNKYMLFGWYEQEDSLYSKASLN